MKLALVAALILTPYALAGSAGMSHAPPLGVTTDAGGTTQVRALRIREPVIETAAGRFPLQLTLVAPQEPAVLTAPTTWTPFIQTVPLRPSAAPGRVIDVFAFGTCTASDAPAATIDPPLNDEPRLAVALTLDGQRVYTGQPVKRWGVDVWSVRATLIQKGTGHNGALGGLVDSDTGRSFIGALFDPAKPHTFGAQARFVTPDRACTVTCEGLVITVR